VAVRIVIEGHDLPGAEFVTGEARLSNVHVAVQVGSHAVGMVPGNAGEARWELDVRTVVEDGEAIDFRGPAVHGRKGERFLYLTWGDVGADSFTMFRRAKLMLSDIDPEVLAASMCGAGVLVASLPLTDERGGPRCARVRPPVITWRSG
jgi:hypothetical protein